jgi:quercetin dioxygenase-like cupin family protein
MVSGSLVFSGKVTVTESGRKKGIAMVELDSGQVAKAEVHWYEAHGVGKVKLKVKKWL